MLNDYTVSLYLRLSSEDENEGESNSIKNQRDLLTQFVSKHNELSHCRLLEFCDDGHSGTNFDRPNVKKLLEKVRNHEVNCIVVKDFSRFGRNYIEVGDYLEQVFPFLGVRFISVNDNYDSDNKNGTIGDIEVAIRTLIYDLYSKDLSQKVKSGLNAKKSRGEFLSSFAIYGYKKSADNKNRLEIDDEAAKVIRQIFELAIAGKRAREIAQILNAQNTLARNEYKALTDCDRDWNRVSKIGSFWKDSMIRKIIIDERYVGTAIGNKYERKCIGSGEIRLTPKESWIVVPDAHPAIVTQDEFQKAQKILERLPRQKAPAKERYLYSKVRCHHCNHAMRRNGGKNPRYCCDTPISIYSPDCVQGEIPESIIEEVLLSAIQTQAKLFGKAEKTRQRRHRAIEAKMSDMRQSIRQFEETVQRLNARKQEHYENYKDGKIAKDEYMFMRESCNKQIDEVTESIAELTEKLIRSVTMTEQKSATNNEWQNCVDISELNREIVDALVDSIIVYDSEHIEIVWKFADEYLS